jgi:hypothetical protein
VRVGVRIRVWIRIRVGIWRSETGGFGIGLSEWRGVRVEEFGFEFEFDSGSLESKPSKWESARMERGGKGRGRRRGWKGEKGSEIV